MVSVRVPNDYISDMPQGLMQAGLLVQTRANPTSQQHQLAGNYEAFDSPLLNLFTQCAAGKWFNHQSGPAAQLQCSMVVPDSAVGLQWL